MKQCIKFRDFKKAYDSVRREVLYNILIEFGIPMKLVSLIKICLNETYSSGQEFYSDRFPIRNGLKHGSALSPLIFSFALEYTIRRVQVKQGGLKLNGTLQLLVYVDNVNILGESIDTIKENAEALIAATKKNGLEINADKSKYMVISGDQNAERSHKVKTDTISFEMVEEIKYLATTLTNQNYTQEEIKSRLKSGSAYYSSMQSLFSSNFLSKNLKIKMYRTRTLPVVLYGCETWPLTLREERKLRVFLGIGCFGENMWA